MKKFSSVICISFLIIFLFVVSLPSICFSEKKMVNNTDDRWVLYTEKGTGVHSFYDRESIITIKEKIKRVWVWDIFSKDSPYKEGMIKLWNEYKQNLNSIGDHTLDNIKMDEMSNMKQLEEIDCNNRTMKTLEEMYFDKNGNFLTNREIKNPQERNVPPDTYSEILFKKICTK